MVNEGIADPDSQKGIDFCVEHCPYNCCVVYEGTVTSKKNISIERSRQANILHRYRVSLRDIALVVGVTEEQVRKYLKK